MKRIYVNGKWADVSDSVSAITYKYFDILNGLDSRTQTYSSSITLPFTARNKSIFGYCDAVGASLSLARGISDVDLYYGNIKVISKGTLKLIGIDNGYNCTINGRNSLVTTLEGITIEDVLDEYVGDHVGSTYSTLVATLASGSTGVLLARDLLDDITGINWNTYNNLVDHTINHWLWFSLGKIFTTIESLASCSIFFSESGAIEPLSSSVMKTVLDDMYIPGYPYIFKYDGSTFWDIVKDVSSNADDSFEFGGDYVLRDTFKVYGGNSAWDMIKHICKLFCCSVIVDADTRSINIIPLVSTYSFDPINLSGRIVNKTRKTPYLEGYEKTNRILYKKTDNAPDDYNAITLTSPVVGDTIKDLFTFDLIIPGMYYNFYMGDTVFKMDLAANSSLLTDPFILYANGDTELTTVIQNYGGDVSTTNVNLEKLRMLDTSDYYSALQDWMTIGEVYDCEMNLNLYDFCKLKPYKLVTVKELGGTFYINKIENWNPDDTANIQLIRAYEL